jgi:hypothetical protein
MERLVKSDSTLIQVLDPITLRNPEDGGDMVYEASVLTRATRYKVPESV